MATTRTALAGQCSINSGPAVDATRIVIEREQIDITSENATEPDLAWEHADTAGHYHAWTSNKELPTLAERRDTQPCSGGCDDPDCDGVVVSTWTCRACGEVVDPGRRTAVERQYMPGRESWAVTVETVVDAVPGELVSVVVAVRGARMFGFATVGDVSAEYGPGGRTATTMLRGVGPLGRR